MLAKFFDILANMGIWIRLNDSRTEPPSGAGRSWGAAVEGFALSLAAHGDEAVSVLIKNLSGVDRHAKIPGWLRYLRIDITAVGGAPVAVKPYGQQILNDPHLATLSERHFPSGKSIATEIPIGALFKLDSSTSYRIIASCPVPGGTDGPALFSNELIFTTNS